MKCTTNAEENMTHAIEKIREASKRGAQIISLHELFQGNIFAGRKIRSFLIWRRRCLAR